MAAQFLRPDTVAIFAKDPTGTAGVVAKIQAFLLTAAKVDIPGRFRPDIIRSYTHTSAYDIARNPVERAVADNFIKRPETLSVSGQLSATPLFPFSGGTGAFGSLVRRDLAQLKALQLLQSVGEPVVVVTPSGIFGSMGLSSIQDTHTMDHKVELSIQLEEVEIASPLSIAGQLDLETIGMGADTSSDLGGQGTSAVADPGVAL